MKSGGMSELQYAMKMFRCGFKTIGDIGVDSIIDHGNEADGSPDIRGCRVTASRRSTDDKTTDSESALEVHISAADGSDNTADMEKRICADIENIVNIDYRAGYCCE